MSHKLICSHRYLIHRWCSINGKIRSYVLLQGIMMIQNVRFHKTSGLITYFMFTFIHVYLFISDQFCDFKNKTYVRTL
jgi:hypothetical protein